MANQPMFNRIFGGSQKPKGQRGSPFSGAGLLQNPMWQASMGLLGARQDARINPWMAMNQGLLNAQQQKDMQQQREDAALQRQDAERARAQEARQQTAVGNLAKKYEQQVYGPEHFGGAYNQQQPPPRIGSTPTAMSEMIRAFPETAVKGLLDQGTARIRAGAPGSTPADVASYKYFAGLDDEEQRDFLNVKRGSQTADFGGVRMVLNPVTNEWETLTGEPLDTAFKTIKEMTEAEAHAEETGRGWGKADVAYELVLQTSVPQQQQQLKEIDELIAAYEAGEFDDTTGLIVGRISPYLTEEGARAAFRGIHGTLLALQITKLTPVSNEEIAMVAKMAEDPGRTVQANIGVLKEVAQKLRSGIKQATAAREWFDDKGTLKGYRPIDDDTGNYK